MSEEGRVSIIKRAQREAALEEAVYFGGGQDDPGAGRAVRTVVSEWVREQGRRSEVYRQTHAALLKELGFR